MRSGPYTDSVGLLDTLFGKKRLKGANLDQLFALSTARVGLEADHGLKPSGAAAVIFKPLSAAEFVGPRTSCRSCSTWQPPSRNPRSAVRAIPTATSGSSCATPTSRIS